MISAEPSLIEQAEKLAAEKDLAQACELLTARAEPLAVLTDLHGILRRAYRAKNIPAMILYSQTALQYAQQTAAQLPADKATQKAELLGRAKAVAYDASANLWPGWNEPGLTLNGTDLAIGLQFAKTNLRLAEELDRRGEPLGHAYWLLGAHELAAKNYSAAKTAFATAASHYVGDYATMALAYRSLADRCSSVAETRTAADKQFHEELAALRASTGKDGKFFAKQLETAAQVFLPPP